MNAEISPWCTDDQIQIMANFKRSPIKYQNAKTVSTLNIRKQQTLSRLSKMHLQKRSVTQGWKTRTSSKSQIQNSKSITMIVDNNKNKIIKSKQTKQKNKKTVSAFKQTNEQIFRSLSRIFKHQKGSVLPKIQLRIRQQ